MKKAFKVKGLDCPNCAARLEKAIQQLEGVDSAVVSFATTKLTLVAADDKFDKIADEVVALAKKMEPDWEIVR